MKAADLRKSILQAAVQGKLVPQDIHDEPASELLKRIKEEKAQLIKDGKLKKEKPLPAITEDEIPYDLPDGWVWCRFQNIASFFNGDRSKNYPNKIDYVFSGVPWINTGHILPNGTLTVDGMNFITEEKYKSLSGGRIAEGDMVFCLRGATFGKVAKVIPYTIGAVASSLVIIRPSTMMNSDFLLYLLKSPHASAELRKYNNGSAQPNLAARDVEKYLIPLPPLAEQVRIVAKVDELMKLCDKLEAAEIDLDELENHFIEYLPKSILQAAVQGKLMPQNVHDEPASELLRRVKEEKTQLIKEGKLKKEKPLPAIADDEIPYDLPDGWVWCRLGDFSKIVMGQSPDGNSVSQNENGMEFHQGKSFYGDKFLKKSNQYTTSPSKVAEANSILLAVRAPVGDVNITNREICIGRGLCAVQTLANIKLEFLYYWLHAMKQEFMMKATGTTFVAITGEVVKNQLLAIPPFAEQARIIARVDELMALCAEIKAAGEAPVKADVGKVIAFPQQEQEPLAMVARGSTQEKLSKQLEAAIDDLFGDDFS